MLSGVADSAAGLQRVASIGGETVTPYCVRSDATSVEIWAGKRIQHGDEARSDWQRVLKGDLRQIFSALEVPQEGLLAGHYLSTSPDIADTENSLFTNMAEVIPRAFTALRFERGTGTPPPPPIPVDLISGHLHYYRYHVGGRWTSWQPDRTIARWARVPRPLPGDDTARPVWYALRQANAGGLVCITPETALEVGENFGLRITVHTPKNVSHKAISNSEFVIDGAIAAFHHDACSDELLAALLPKLPGVTEPELRQALSCCAGPVFPTPAVRVFKGGAVQISPADDRCWLGEYTVRRDSANRCLEISGELFTLRPQATSQ